MRITRVEPIVVNATPHTNWVFVRLDTDDGLSGVGEATLVGNEPAVVAALETLGRALAGQDPFRIDASGWGGSADMVQVVAVSGLEQAAWDLRGKACGMPVHALLGSRRSIVPVYANINRGTRDRSPDGFAARAAAAVAAGYLAVKCAPFDEYLPWKPERSALDMGVRRVEAIRAALPDRVALMVDCHWRFDVPTAIDVGTRLAPLGLFWYECPVPEVHPADTLEVKTRTGLRIACGELKTRPRDYTGLLMAGCADVLMPDIKFVGGIQGLLKIGALADAFGVSVAPHNPSGPVATAATLQAAAALDALVTLEYQFAEVEWYADLVQAEFVVTRGHMTIPTAPGLGIALDRALAAKHPYQPVRPLQDPKLIQRGLMAADTFPPPP